MNTNRKVCRAFYYLRFLIIIAPSAKSPNNAIGDATELHPRFLATVGSVASGDVVTPVSGVSFGTVVESGVSGEVVTSGGFVVVSELPVCL